MTKVELIKALEKFPDDAKVYVWGGNSPVVESEIKAADYRTDMRVAINWSAVSDSNIEGIYLH